MTGLVPTVPVQESHILQEYWRWRATFARQPVPLAIAQARLGDAEGALIALERAHAERDPMFPFVHLYPEFRALRTMDRYKAIRTVRQSVYSGVERS